MCLRSWPLIMLKPSHRAQLIKWFAYVHARERGGVQLSDAGGFESSARELNGLTIRKPACALLP